MNSSAASKSLFYLFFKLLSNDFSSLSFELDGLDIYYLLTWECIAHRRDVFNSYLLFWSLTIQSESYSSSLQSSSFAESSSSLSYTQDSDSNSLSTFSISSYTRGMWILVEECRVSVIPVSFFDISTSSFSLIEEDCCCWTLWSSSN